MKIASNKVVALTYELTVDGKVVDKATEERPLDYIHGTHMLIPRFEEEVQGKEPGEGFEFTLQPEEGYGEWDPQRSFDIPKDAFMIDGVIREDLLKIGAVIPMLNSSDQVVRGTVTAIKENAVTMDFNHPMAGKVLNFKGKVVSVRDAAPDELEYGLHGEYKPQEGKCHCHGEGKGDHECCHGEGKGDHECCHGEGKGEHECCHGEGHCKHQEGRPGAEEVPEDHRDKENE